MVEEDRPFEDLLQRMEEEITRQGLRVTDRPDWNEYFMAVAEVVALRSTCYNRKVGSVIVRDKRIVASGYNGAAAGNTSCFELNYCERKQRKADEPLIPEEHAGKYETDEFVMSRLDELGKHRSQRFCRAMHSEANAINQAARQGIPIEGADMYVTLEPCENCTKQIISSQLNHVYIGRPYRDSDKFDSDLSQSLTAAMLQSNTSFEFLHVSDRTRILLSYEMLANNVSRNRSR